MIISNLFKNNLFLNIWEHLSLKKKVQYCCLLVIIIFASFLEAISIGAIIPFLTLISQKELTSNINFAILNSLLVKIKDEDRLLIYTLIFASAAILSTIIRILMIWFQTKITFECGAELSKKIYEIILNQPYNLHLARSSSDIISLVTLKTNAIVHNGLYPLAIIFSSICIACTIFSLLILISPFYTIVTSLSILVVYLVLAYSVKNILHKDSLKINNLTVKQIQLIQEGIGGIRDILLSGTQSIFVKIYAQADRNLKSAYSRQLVISSIPRYILEGTALTLIAIFSYNILLSNSNDNTSLIVVLGVMAFTAQRTLPIIQQTYSSWVAVSSGRESILEALEFINNNKQIKRDVNNKIINLNNSIECKNISFRYENSEKYVLNNINLLINKGDSIGIIGKSGGGKSTLFDILMGLLTPTKGKILIDDIEIDCENLLSWQKNISHVPQFIYLSDYSIAENIAFGIAKNKINIDTLNKVIEQSQLKEFVESLPLGVNTLIGERGVNLSGGQRQRIGIARALYRRKNILFFDEATSALDIETENLIIKCIEAIEPKITLIMITHRVSTLKNCKKILNLNNVITE
jgi:ABC-type multidrug transport system fused ATPase/permease subunit